MQRSSSLVWNAEQSWGQEKVFLDELKEAINVAFLSYNCYWWYFDVYQS